MKGEGGGEIAAKRMAFVASLSLAFAFFSFCFFAFVGFTVSQLHSFGPQTPTEFGFSASAISATHEWQIDSLLELARFFQRCLLLSVSSELIVSTHQKMFGIKRTNKWFLYFRTKICLHFWRLRMAACPLKFNRTCSLRSPLLRGIAIGGRPDVVLTRSRAEKPEQAKQPNRGFWLPKIPSRADFESLWGEGPNLLEMSERRTEKKQWKTVKTREKRD